MTGPVELIKDRSRKMDALLSQAIATVVADEASNAPAVFTSQERVTLIYRELRRLERERVYHG